ncbi:MAG TPA: redoxin domain-containing protein [Chloroflexia bacterium]|nr:redoxin domain-containing protein [Chloroflexia bacterium]
MEGIWLISFIALWIIVIGEGVLILLLYRQLGILYLGTAAGVSRDGLPVGSTAPEFALPDAEGHVQSLSSYRGRNVLLLFGSPQCDPCRRLLPGLQEFAAGNGREFAVLWLNQAAPEVTRHFQAETGATLPMLSYQGGVNDAYRVRVTPFLFMIDPAGVIKAKGLVNTKSQLDWYRDLFYGKASLQAPQAPQAT